MKKKIINIFDGKVFTYLCRFAFAIFLIGVVSQIGLRNEPTRETFTKIESYEGIEVKNGGAIVKGTVEFCVTEGEPSEDYHILVNGEKVDVLDKKKKELDLYSSAVVEIYPAKKGQSITVTLDCKDSNIEAVMDKKSVVVTDNIEVINKIIFK